MAAVIIVEEKDEHGSKIYVAYREGKKVGFSRYYNDLCHLLEPNHLFYLAGN